MNNTEQPTVVQRWGRFGIVFAAVWLVFLLEPLARGWEQRDEPNGWLGIVATVSFAVYFLRVFSDARLGRTRRRQIRPPLRRAVVDMAVLTGLAVVMTVTLGESGLASTVFLAVSAVTLLPTIAGGAFALAVAGVVELLASRAGWNVSSLPLAVCAAAFAMAGVIALMNRNIVLLNQREEDERRAVQEERARMARDLHDILGHSLTVITVKAELANRLLDVDLGRARAELDDLERLSRDALTDVRSTVEGFRGVSLPVEIARAREALRVAGIEADLPNSTDAVPSRLRELFAWSVREGVTNVLRHSGARQCTVTVDERCITILDDGVGATGTGSGNGLTGLRERAAAAGARVIMTHPQPHGFSLQVIAEEAP
ncbi:sensor histidine kinase [Rhodococcus sp. W8901]|uniref:sensor histidine kinase n=1 Tax=Rhodococcus sp. W8901 TaxID=2742603 RepID=UPI0015824CCB|nr:histidine kinase [Rhodococcus sp. W8901]QKT10262.1 histidine kinase [Rhodococcus sp. W8901]